MIMGGSLDGEEQNCNVFAIREGKNEKGKVVRGEDFFLTLLLL